MAIEYLGSKRRLLGFVVEPMAALPGVAAVADLFCGTAAVAGALKAAGKRVVANDHLELCATLAEAALLTDGPPAFAGLGDELGGDAPADRYAALLARLDGLAPIEGFFHRTYSPASTRLYLTEANAGRVDAIRSQIAAWEPRLTRAERAVLLRDLVRAVAAVSNTAGTYGCYLKHFKRRALAPLALTPAPPGPAAPVRPGGHVVRCEEAEAVAGDLTGVDAVYLDPPYTKRQYAAYYHLLETLVSGATPVVAGSTGLPPWHAKQSDFCHRRRAPGALERLVARLDVPHVFLSYSDDGHVAHDEILEILGGHGRVAWRERRRPRYRSSALEHRAASVRERLYHLEVA